MHVVTPGDIASAAAPYALLLTLAFVAAASVVGAVRHGLKCKPNHCGCPFPFLWVTGKALNGHVYTDATFWHGHNKVVGAATGHCPPFQKLPGWKRRALRNGPLLLPGALLASWLLTVTALAVVGAAWIALRYTGSGRRGALCGCTYRRRGNGSGIRSPCSAGCRTCRCHCPESQGCRPPWCRRAWC